MRFHFSFHSLIIFIIISSPRDHRPASSSPLSRHASVYPTACQQYAHLLHFPYSSFLCATHPRFSRLRSSLLLALFLLSGDVHPNPGPSYFTVCSLNIRSILHPLHSAALSDIIDTHHPDLFCLTETWIKPTTTSSELIICTPPNYSLLSFPRHPSIPYRSSCNIGGGTGFLIREPFTHLPSSIPAFSSFESSVITLKLPHSKLSVFNIYRPPNSSPFSKPVSLFLDEFHSFLSIAVTSPHEFLITGDFNFHLDHLTDSHTTQFLSLLSSFNLTQHVNFPTHNQNHILDLVITSSDSLLAPSLFSNHLSPSDHFPVFTKLSVERTPLPPPTLLSFRRFHSMDFDTFLYDLQHSPLITNPPQSLGSLLISYNITLSSLLDKHAPIITKLSTRTSKSNPWFTPALRAFRSTVRHAENIWKRTHSASDHSIFRCLCNQYHKLILSAKKRYYSNLISSSSNNPRHLWKTVNHLLHRKSLSPLPSFSSLVSLADHFASFFTDKISKLRLSFSGSSTMSPHSESPASLPPQFSVFKPASQSEISKILLNCPNKQSDLDPIPTWLLKKCASVLIPTITNIVNLSLTSGQFHPVLKESVISPLLKKPSLDQEQLSNYRPISNLSLISKIIERVVKSRLTDHLSHNNLLNPHQSAYCKHHSTETALVYIHDYLINAIGSQQISCLCLLDLSAAFDTIDHNILLNRLSSWFGLQGPVLNWFKSYLSSRTFSVKCHSNFSSPLTSTCGVPQGSVLGPLLFIMYTTPLSTLISSLSLNHHLYADDTQIFFSFHPSDFDVNFSRLQDSLQLISSWMHSNLLTLNSSKTEFLLIGLKKQLLKVNSSSLNTSHSARNLGFVFDQHLTFSDQIDAVSKSCYFHIRQLRCIRPYLDFKTASTIATSIVHSKLDYCNSLYYNLPVSQLKRLQHIQNSLARTVVQAPKFSHASPILKDLHWLKIKERIEYKLLSLTFKVLTTSQPVYLHNLISVQPPHCTRSSSVLTLARPSVSSSLKITNRSFRFSSPHLWNQLPHSLRQPRSNNVSPFSYTLLSSQSSSQSPLSPSITPSLFHSRLKTYLFLKSFPP